MIVSLFTQQKVTDLSRVFLFIRYFYLDKIENFIEEG